MASKLLIFAVALAALAVFAFADVGPGPSDLPSVTISATIDGSPVQENTSVKMHCFMAEGQDEFMGPTATYGCDARGICTGSMYKLCPCGHAGNATFEFSNPAWARNYTTSPMMEMFGGYDYYFNVSISTANGTAAISGGGTPQIPRPCGTIVVLLALLAAPVAATLLVWRGKNGL